LYFDASSTIASLTRKAYSDPFKEITITYCYLYHVCAEGQGVSLTPLGVGRFQQR